MPVRPPFVNARWRQSAAKGRRTVLVVPSAQECSDPFEGRVCRFGDTSGEPFGTNHHSPLSAGKLGVSEIPRAVPIERVRNGEPRVADGWSTLHASVVPSPRRYPQRAKRTSRTPPDHGVRPATPMHPPVHYPAGSLGFAPVERRIARCPAYRPVEAMRPRHLPACERSECGCP